jgi:hypothetical protein
MQRFENQIKNNVNLGHLVYYLSVMNSSFKACGNLLGYHFIYIQESLKDEKFAEFIRDQEDRPEVMGLKVGALLITPVQRIPR